ncbi:single-stranded-DNA-specific exonuclease RecJ [Candidatus Uhrbacteria bacterium]|nr:single-stranded-DNA-specific exonuclease RecJ [Candidatus Uhrbacteria bacterium]
MKQWVMAQDPPKKFYAQFPDIPEVVARLLYHRDITTQDAIDEFLHPDYGSDIHDPFLFRDMQKAVDRVFLAIAKKEKIVVHGDYDADGVCAATILVETITVLGGVTDIFIPHRETEGYGVNMNTVELLAHDKTNLVITCDCGISNTAEIARAKELGMDVIVTDHHSIPKELPPAYAIIHPKIAGEPYPWKELCGGGVAFKLAQGLLRASGEKQVAGEDIETFQKWLLDCVAISSVADMVSLLGETRTLTRYGLTVLQKTRRPGLQALFRIAGFRTPFDAGTIGFGIAPRLNAAGRMQHANTAYQLLITKKKEEAERLAEELNAANKERQNLTESLAGQAREQVGEAPKTMSLVVSGENWPLSLAGLIASKLSKEYARPAFALVKKETQWSGSARSPDAVDIMVALDPLREEIFEKFGGHPQACGFTLKEGIDPKQFHAAIEKRIRPMVKKGDLAEKISIDAPLPLSQLHWELYDILQQFEPFGMDNPRPVYAAHGCKVLRRNEVGNDGKHLQLFLEEEGSGVQKKAIGFSLSKELEHIAVGDRVDIAYEVDVNTWNGNRELVVKLVDVRKI